MAREKNYGQSKVLHAVKLTSQSETLLSLFGHSVLSDSSQPHGLQPTRLLCPWDSPGKNTGVGCHFLFQEEEIPPGHLPGPGIEPTSPVLAGGVFSTEPPEKPRVRMIPNQIHI